MKPAGGDRTRTEHRGDVLFWEDLFCALIAPLRDMVNLMSNYLELLWSGVSLVPLQGSLQLTRGRLNATLWLLSGSVPQMVLRRGEPVGQHVADIAYTIMVMYEFLTQGRSGVARQRLGLNACSCSPTIVPPGWVQRTRC